MAKRKVSDYLRREEGMVGNRSAFAAAALVSTTTLAMTLLVAPEANADPNGDWCGNANHGGYCNHEERCCVQGQGAFAVYWCIPEDQNC